MTDSNASESVSVEGPAAGEPAPARASRPAGLHALSRYRTTAVALILIALVLGLLQTYTTSPRYLGRAVLRIEREPFKPAVPTRRGMPLSSAADRFAQKEIQLAQSRELGRQVVRRLGLADDPELLNPAGPQGIDGNLVATAGRVARPLRSILASRPRPRPADRAAGSPADEAKAVEAIGSNLTVTADRATDRFTIAFTSGSPHLAALVANAVAEELVAETLDQRRTMLRDRLATAARVIATVDHEIAADRARLAQGSSDGSARRGALEERLRRNEQSRDELRMERKALTILQTSVSATAGIVERAEVPAQPYAPDPGRNLLVALLVGVALAFGAAFGLEYLDDTIQTPEDITGKLHLPFLGLVPAVRSHRQPLLSGPVPHDFGEAYRALRTSLVFTTGGESTRMVAITSARPLEGKTTTACNLAMVLAFGGSRVLLIDADLRDPGVHKLLELGNTVGLSQLLSGQARVREAIQRTRDPNLCVISAGRVLADPGELLASKRMVQLAASLKQGPFDWIVIDTPPVLSFDDAAVLAPLVDSVTLVHGAEMTRRSVAEAAVRRLMASQPRAIGGVLNRVKVERNKYYYSRYYGGQDAAEYHAGAADATAARA